MFGKERKTWLILMLGLMSLALMGCSDDDDDVTNPIDANTSQMRVVHASSDAPAVDIYVSPAGNGKQGGDPAVANLGYGAASNYVEIAPGTYDIRITATGDDATAFEILGLAIPAEVSISAVAVGLLASSDDADKFRVLPLVENFADPGAGNVAVRIVHGSPDAPTVAIDVANDDTADITGLDRFAEVSAALPAGVNRLGIWAGEPLARVTVFTTPALAAGSELFVIATGLLASDPSASDGFGLLAVAPSGAIGIIDQDESAIVYALHASPDAPAVDIDAGASEVVDNLAFGQLSAPLQVLPASYTLNFRAHNDMAVAATAMTPYLEPGQTYLAIASGFLGDASFTLLPFAESFPLMAMDAYVQVLHASPDAPAVDVGTFDGSAVTAVPDFVNLEYGESSVSGGTMLPIANLTLGIAATGTSSAVATFDVATAAGLRAFAVAAGSLGGTGESFRLILVDTGADPWAAVEVAPN